MLYRLGHTVLKPLSRVLYRPTIVGAQNVPLTGGVIIASNHLSFIDSFAIPLTAPRQVHYLAKDDYFTGTGVRGYLSREVFEGVGAIPVDRHSSRAAQESLDAALKVLREGEVFGIYPEGTRSRDGRLYRGRTGVGFLALTAKVPVVPVGLAGTQDILPVDARFPRRAKVSVTFGTPLYFTERYEGVPQGRARRGVTDEIMDAIASLSGQERAEGYNEIPSEPGPQLGT